MDTNQSTVAEGRFELEEKYRNWKETYLPAGEVSVTFSLAEQLEVLGNECLKAAHEAALAGLVAEKLLAHTKPIANFHYAAGLTTDLLSKRGMNNQWPKTQPDTTTGAGLPGAPLKHSPPLLLNTLGDVQQWQCRPRSKDLSCSRRA